MGKLHEKYELLRKGELNKILDEFRHYSIIFGKIIKVTTPSGVIEGEAIDIDEEGSLILRLQSGVLKKIYAGECSIQE
jgi:BirA family biotin operon repressor/biotin-[acetyl-CoA-carboxylase] ligase